jgi:mercuric reductase
MAEGLEHLELDIRGMTCNACAAHVTRALQEAAGVQEVNVPGWQSGRATVVAESGTDADLLAAAVEQVGYRAAVKSRRPVSRMPTHNGGTHDYDLMVIGGGSAGFAAAIKGAELGFSVAIVEAATIGGTCVNVGCVPSKTLIRSVELHHLAGQHRFRGVHTHPGRLDWPDVIAHKDELVAELRQAKYADVLAGYPNITYIEGRAGLTGKNGIVIDGHSYTSGKIVIATGAHPWTPPIPGLNEGPYLTSTTAMDLKERPHSLIVLGANAVGLELAQTFARAGTEVTVLELLPRIVPFEDEAISIALADYLQAEGIQITTGFQTDQVERRDGRFYLVGNQTCADAGSNGRSLTFEAEQLLVATGRRPSTANMGLETAGIRLGKRGEILVNETLQTDNPFVYAAGDVTGRDMFVYTAAYAGGLAAENALTGAGRIYDASYIPRITFTDPQVASAGLTEAQAREQGYDMQVSTLPMTHAPRALAARDTRGLIKLIVDSRTHHLLGAHVLAPEGGEIIQVAALALRFGLTADQLRETMFPYLTNVEGLKLALLGLEKDVALLSCCAG